MAFSYGHFHLDNLKLYAYKSSHYICHVYM